MNPALFIPVLKEHKPKHERFQLVPKALNTFVTSSLHFLSLQHGTSSLHPQSLLHCCADLPAFLQARMLFLPSPKSQCYFDHWGREGREERFLNYLEETDQLEELTKEIEMVSH